MKKRSAFVPAGDEVHPEMSIKKQVAVAVNAMQEKDPWATRSLSRPSMSSSKL